MSRFNLIYQNAAFWLVVADMHILSIPIDGELMNFDLINGETIEIYFINKAIEINFYQLSLNLVHKPTKWDIFVKKTVWKGKFLYQVSGPNFPFLVFTAEAVNLTFVESSRNWDVFPTTGLNLHWIFSLKSPQQ